MGKIFNPLNGRELEAVVLNELKKLMKDDVRFDSTTPIGTSLMATFSVTIRSYPNEPFGVQTAGVYKAQAITPAAMRDSIWDGVRRELDADLRFSPNVTYPQVQWEPRLTVEPIGGTLVEAARPTAAPLPAPVVKPLSVVEETPEPSTPEQIRIAQLEAEVARLRGPQDTRPTDPERVISSAELNHRDFNPHTATGLEMERGWKDSPGASLAMPFGAGSAMGAHDLSGGLEIGRSDAGEVRAPDALRRENGLTVPSTHQVGHQIVDISGF